MDAARAGSAQEFRAKYEGKRITKKTLWKLPVIDYLYQVLYPHEAMTEGKQLSLSDKYRQKLRLMNEAEAGEVQEQAERCYSLFYWARQEGRIAALHLEIADGGIYNASKILDSIKQAEDIRKHAGHYIAQAPEAAEAFTALSIIDLDGTIWSEGNGWALPSIYQSISSNMRYVIAYNAIIGYIAEEIQIPEFAQLQASLQHTIDGISIINQAVDNLKEAISYRYDETEAPETMAKGFQGLHSINAMSQSHMRRALRAIQPQIIDIDKEYSALEKEAGTDGSFKRAATRDINDIINGKEDTIALSIAIERICYNKTREALEG